MIDRIQLVLTTKDLTPARFADEIGVQRSSVSHILSGRNRPSLDFIQKVLTQFPDIGSSWLVLGQGKMYPAENSETDSSEARTVTDSIAKPVEPSKPDLFSTQSEDESFDNDTAKSDLILNSRGEQGEDYDSDQNELPDPAKEKAPHSKVKGNIDKIVVLYRNGTFKVYSPG